MQRPGVVAVQGDFEKHITAFEKLGVAAKEVRVPEDLLDVDCCVIPGGESTTVGLLMQRFGLGQAIQERVRAGMPIWGTCMGMILLAKRIEGRADQYTLGLLDITVRRNAFGRQVHSFEDHVVIDLLEEPVLGVFIRAPICVELGSNVKPIATYKGNVVGVRQGSVLGTSFHPELTEDTSLHKWFLNQN